MVNARKLMVHVATIGGGMLSETKVGFLLLAQLVEQVLALAD